MCFECLTNRMSAPLPWPKSSASLQSANSGRRGGCDLRVQEVPGLGPHRRWCRARCDASVLRNGRVLTCVCVQLIVPLLVACSSSVLWLLALLIRRTCACILRYRVSGVELGRSDGFGYHSLQENTFPCPLQLSRRYYQ